MNYFNHYHTAIFIANSRFSCLQLEHHIATFVDSLFLFLLFKNPFMYLERVLNFH